MEAQAEPRPSTHPKSFSIGTGISLIVVDAACRTRGALQHAYIFLPVSLGLLPRASAVDGAAGTGIDFTPQQSNDTKTKQDVDSMINFFDFAAWRAQGAAIRGTFDKSECFGNLSLALASSGPLFSVEASGTAGALSLLPTAGALIGAPSKELWVLYKLMPIAGVLSMLLSLGGNIVPSQISDYTASALHYGGFIASIQRQEASNRDADCEPMIKGSKFQEFASRVQRRADNDRGGRKRLAITIGISLQLGWLAILMIACWFTESGGIVVWWCTAWGWMHFWYLMVASSSILENIAGTPFSKQYTIRVSRAPEVRISRSAPLVVPNDPDPLGPSGDLVNGKNSSIMSALGSSRPNPLSMREVSTDTISRARAPSYNQPETFDTLPSNESHWPGESAPGGNRTANPEVQRIDSLGADYRSQGRAQTPMDLLAALEIGYNTTGRVSLDSDEWSAHRVPFYVIVSLEGITPGHATLRVISKAISVGVFAAGTAIFASSSLIPISLALTVLCLVLGVGVFGRVVAMWMASEMMKSDPIIHCVAENRADAAEYIMETLSLPGLTFEVLGHVILNGRCIQRYSHWMRLSTFLGILASPYNVSKIAGNQPRR